MLFADVSITHLTFSKEFTKAIEQKQVAEQDAERQLYVVQQAEQEKLVRTCSKLRLPVYIRPVSTPLLP